MHPVVELPGPGRPRGIGVGGFLLALVTAGALAHVAVRLKGIEVAYDLGKERRINTQLEEQRRRLHIEIGMLKDPVRVVELARDQLGMGPPAPGDIVRLGSDGSLTLGRATDHPPGDAAAAAAAARPRAAKGSGTKPASKPPVAASKPSVTASKPAVAKPSASKPPVADPPVAEPPAPVEPGAAAPEADSQ